MNTARPIPAGISGNSRAWRGGRLAPLAVLLILTAGFSTTWVSAGRDHPARVSFMDGRAAYESSGDVDWNEVTLNLPLVSGDRIVAHPDSRIEVELGDGNFVRISGETDIFFTELSRKKTLLKIHQGDLILRVNDSGSVHLEMELAGMRIRKKGLYRIQADPDGKMRLVVHKGRAEVSSRHGKERVETGQELLLDARQVGIQALVRDLDDFELWSGRRDALLVSSRSTGYLGGVDYPGVHTLDRHGHWAHYGTPRARLGTCRSGRMDAVSARTVVLPRRRLDLGQLRALGLAALPLRELDLLRAPLPMGLGARGIQSMASGSRRFLLGKRLRRLGAARLLWRTLPWPGQHDRRGSEQHLPELESTGPLQRADRHSRARSGKGTGQNSSRGLQHHREKFPSGSSQRSPASAGQGAERRVFEKRRPLLEAGFRSHRAHTRSSRDRRLPALRRHQEQTRRLGRPRPIPAIIREPFRSNRVQPGDFPSTSRFPAERAIRRERRPHADPGAAIEPFHDHEPESFPVLARVQRVFHQPQQPAVVCTPCRRPERRFQGFSRPDTIPAIVRHPSQSNPVHGFRHPPTAQFPAERAVRPELQPHSEPGSELDPFRSVQPEFYSTFVQVRRFRHQPHQPQPGKALRFEFPGVEAFVPAVILPTVGRILVPIQLSSRGAVATFPQAVSLVSRSLAAEEQAVQPQRAVRTQSIRLIRRQFPLSTLIQGPLAIPAASGCASARSDEPANGNGQPWWLPVPVSG